MNKKIIGEPPSSVTKKIARKKAGPTTSKIEKIVIDGSHRLSGINASVAEQLLKAAAQLLVPEDQRQRRALIPLIPHLYVLRSKGCSWEQLASLLTKGGFKLQPASLRQYYNEELAMQKDICEEHLAASLLVIAETRKYAAAMEQPSIDEQLKAKAVQVRAAAAGKLNAIFGLGGAVAPRPPALPLEVETVAQDAKKPPSVRNKKPGSARTLSVKDSKNV